ELRWVFFFQAEDGIRDFHVTGVQTCALPICTAALAAYGFVATFQPDPHFGRILAAYGGVFVAGSLAWGVIADGFRPDRYDLLGRSEERRVGKGRGTSWAAQKAPPLTTARPAR